jgi:RNA polymerase sigma-70 factor (ECF subfamily)
MVLEDFLTLADDDLVARVRAGETALYEALMRRYNQRLFRAIRSVIRDDAEAEDVLQDAWVRAFEHLAQFEGRSSFSTWITKIAIYEALGRVRKAKRFSALDEGGEEMHWHSGDNPEQTALRGEIGRALQAAVDALPANYRPVFVLREAEGMSTAETAECLGLTEEAVKTRLHRSKAMLRREITERIGPAVAQVYAFLGVRCDRVVAGVMRRVRQR